MKQFLTMVVVVGLVAPLSALRAEGNLDDRGSVIKPRVQEGTQIAVDAGLAFLLNKYINNAKGEQKIALEKAQENLRKAVERSEKLARGEKVSLVPVSKEAKLAFERAEQMAKDIEAAEASAMKGGNFKFSPGVMFDGVPSAKVLSGSEELLHARNQAAEALKNATAEMDALTVAKNGSKLKVLRIAGNAAIVLDAVGHGWAFYENSKTPLMLGGIYKLGSEGTDGVFSLIEAMRKAPAADTLPRRSDIPTKLDDKGNHVPDVRNNLPPLQKTRPTLPGPKLP